MPKVMINKRTGQDSNPGLSDSKSWGCLYYIWFFKPPLNLPRPGRFWLSKHSPVIFLVPVIPVEMTAAFPTEGTYDSCPNYKHYPPQMAHRIPRIGRKIRRLPLGTSTAFPG